MSPLLKKRNGSDETYLLRKYCLIAGLLAAAVMMFTYLCHDNTLTFGKNTVLRMDLYHQYGPLYAELYDRIVHGYSLVYSWTSGLGGAFLGNLYNYCCSPFALVILLTGHQNMPDAIAIMILLNAVLSAVTFTYYINKSTGTVQHISIGFALLYTFSGYFVAYSWNIMWLDAMAMFPLVMLGVEKIIQKNKPSLYIFAMTYTMVTSYYMAYMVCILSVLYFLYYYFSRYELSSPLLRKKDAPAEGEEGFEVIAPASPLADPASPESAAQASAAEADAIATAVTEEAAAIDAAINAASAQASPAFTEGFTLSEDAPDELPVTGDLTEPAPPAPAQEPAATAAPPEGFVYAEPIQPSVPVAPQAVGPQGKKAKKRKEKKDRLRLRDSRFWVSGWSFALASVLCFLLSSFALIPVYYCLQTSSATGGTFPTTMKVYFNLFDFVANHLPALTTTIRSSGDIVLPNIYCGLLSVLLLPFYFFSKHVSGRKKIAAVVFIGVFYLSFSLNYLNYIWHGMHMPNDLPFRYSFGYTFLLLVLGYEVFRNIGEFSNRMYVGAGVGVIAFAILVDKLGQQNVTSKTVNIVLIFAVVYVVLLGLLRSKRFERNAVISLLIIAIIAELGVSDVSNFVMEQPKANYVTDYPDYQQIKQATEGEDGDLFYRTELSKLRARMDPCWYGYNGVSTFSSMAYEHVAKLMENLGMFGNDINSYTYYPQTPIFNSMFALKYIYDNGNLISNNEYYKQVAANDSFTSYRYQYALPVAFAVNDAITEWDLTSENPFEGQNDLMAKATGVSDILIPAEVTELGFDNVNDDVSTDLLRTVGTFTISKRDAGSDGTFTAYIDVTEPGQYYVYSGSTRVTTISVFAGDFEYSYSSSAVQPFTLDLGYQEEGARIRLVYTLSDDSSASVDLYAVRIDSEKFRQAYDKLKENGLLQLTEFDETRLSGTVKVSGADKLLYTSIPYDESWGVYIDGEYVPYDSGEIVKVGDALLGVYVTPGEHQVTFRYQARGLGLGLRMTAFGLLIVALMLLWKFFLAEKLKGRFTLKLFRHPDWEIA